MHKASVCINFSQRGHLIDAKLPKWFDKYLTTEIERLIREKKIDTQELNSKINETQQIVDKTGGFGLDMMEVCEMLNTQVAILKNEVDPTPNRF